MQMFAVLFHKSAADGWIETAHLDMIHDFAMIFSTLNQLLSSHILFHNSNFRPKVHTKLISKPL